MDDTTLPHNIKRSDVNKILASVRDNRDIIIKEWVERFGELSYKDEQR